MPRAQRYELIWAQTMSSRTRDVDVYVAKLADAAADWAFIHTHQKFGYRLAPIKLA